jgi:DNA-binding NarL/FixJ family response regulator
MKDPFIFIVDPNPIHGNMVKYQLSVRKFNNLWLFSSVEECIYRLRKQQPDVLITEYSLGNYRGEEMVQMVRKISPQTIILFLTTVEDAGLAQAMLAEGARDYIVKSGHPELSITELIRNMEFLFSEIQYKEN